MLFIGVGCGRARHRVRDRARTIPSILHTPTSVVGDVAPYRLTFSPVVMESLVIRHVAALEMQASDSLAAAFHELSLCPQPQRPVPAPAAKQRCDVFCALA